ncbi:putative disease resistance RPP13-like protein 1 [Morella rubra]|uniref:Putative disease resistance RPP13-like protein 1 n=1 Tax=Morella rubra TaxID=262757 RepID=A0A6A1WLK1_9ROSI|nr:putative disease resistance RPP13-like protein 1 [Morella rubra]
MAEVGGALLSAFLKVLIDRAASREINDFLRGQKLIAGLVNKLKIALLAVNVLVEDAEEKQATKPYVKTWLDELKDAVYNAEDILDRVATQALRRKLDAEFETAAIKVRNRTYASLSLYKLRGKIEEVLDKLKSLAEQKDVIGLREGVTGRPWERLPTTSLVEESCIFGRDDDKEEIIKGLLSEDKGGNELGVIAIVGMGGMGKTTLAQRVYNDERVKKHFDLEVWVCVSEDFDLFKVTKTILEAVTMSTTDIRDLNQLQVKLREKLMGKCFLLILDDVWNKSFDNWEALSKPWKSGAQGSKVIVTTRDEGVASITNASLPLAAKAIGAMLRPKANVDEWERILNSELWNLSIEETKILPALRVSYKNLPSHLKQCFAYCAIFPKDYNFTKDQLVLLWMAEGFLQDVGNKTMEEIGEDYFHDLVSRSLFQQSVDHETHFLMHDLINDLAKFVSGQFSFRLNVDLHREGFPKTRYLSYMRTAYYTFEKFEALCEAKQLRTFLPLELAPKKNCFSLTKKVLYDLLPTLRCLRVLSLSHYGNITELPESIGKMKHLRYLDISFTKVTRLPEAISKLCNLQILKLSGCRYLTLLLRDMGKLVNLLHLDITETGIKEMPMNLSNLQTLKLSGCRDLTALPRDMEKLVNLRHLDITETGIKEMPMHLGNLKSLQTLPTFIVSKCRGSGSGLKELGKLANLRRTLSILELQNVESPQEALDANLKNKKYLEKLVLSWNDLECEDADILESQRSVLDNLQPHPNLKSLTVNYYSGGRFPDWVGHNSFSNITSLQLKNCKYCCSLPPLGQLHSLQNLSIVGFDAIVTVSSKFYGTGSLSMKPFGSLKVLYFEEMRNWETWFTFGAENEDGAFPSLGELYIKKCPKLTGWFSIHLPSLTKLEIDNCPQLVISLRRAPAIRELGLMRCNEVLLRELPVAMQRLRVEGFDSVESLPEGLMDSNNVLQELKISDCSSLVSLPTGGLPATLKKFQIRHCMKFELPTLLDYSFLEELELFGCDSLRSFPLDLFSNLKSIEY